MEATNACLGCSQPSDDDNQLKCQASADFKWCRSPAAENQWVGCPQLGGQDLVDSMGNQCLGHVCGCDVFTNAASGPQTVKILYTVHVEEKTALVTADRLNAVTPGTLYQALDKALQQQGAPGCAELKLEVIGSKCRPKNY
jgi:hypothetical protein